MLYFFSGNGLYYPNTISSFCKTVVEQNRYEWWNIGHSEEIIKQAGRIIYVRDVYKQFYVKGINAEINCIDKLCELLKELTMGMRVVTCGNSAGGYMSVIAGQYLQAKCIYSFGGQFTLEHLFRESEDDLAESYYYVEYNKDNKKINKYYNLLEMLQRNKVPIMFFYSALCEGDSEQFEVLNKAKSSNIFCFAMKSKQHGHLMFNKCYQRVVSTDLTKLLKLYEHYKGKMISFWSWCLHLLEWNEAIMEIVKDVICKMKSVFYRR